MTDIMEVARTTKHTSVKLGRNDLCIAQTSDAYDCMVVMQVLLFSIKVTQEARQRVVREISAER